MSLINELKRRNVFRVGFAYVMVAWVSLQAIDFILDIISAPNLVIQVIFVVALGCLPLVLVFAWVYELTPEGLKKEKDVDRSQSVTQGTGSKLDRTIIIFLVLAVVLLLAERFVVTEETVSTPEAVSVEELAVPDEQAGSSLRSVAAPSFADISSEAGKPLTQESTDASSKPSITNMVLGQNDSAFLLEVAFKNPLDHDLLTKEIALSYRSATRSATQGMGCSPPLSIFVLSDTITLSKTVGEKFVLSASVRNASEQYEGFIFPAEGTYYDNGCYVTLDLTFATSLILEKKSYTNFLLQVPKKFSVEHRAKHDKKRTPILPENPKTPNYPETVSVPFTKTTNILTFGRKVLTIQMQVEDEIVHFDFDFLEN